MKCPYAPHNRACHVFCHGALKRQRQAVRRPHTDTEQASEIKQEKVPGVKNRSVQIEVLVVLRFTNRMCLSGSTDTSLWL